MSKKLKYFGAEWCPQCQMMKPMVEDWCQKNDVEFIYMDAEVNETDAKMYDILNLPTMVNPDNNKMKSGVFPPKMLEALYE